MSKLEAGLQASTPPEAPAQFRTRNGETAVETIRRLFPQNGQPIQTPALLRYELPKPHPGIADLNDGHMQDEPIHNGEVGTEDIIALYLREISREPLLTAVQEIELAQRMERGNEARQQLLQIADATDTKALEEVAREGDEARKKMVKANLRLVVSVAKKYQGLGLPLLDMAQEGSIGLNRAAEKYDWRRGYRFSTYAYWWIRQAVTRAIADYARTIRLPVHQIDSLRILNNVDRDLSQKLGREPTDEELAEISGLSLDRIEELHRVSQFTGSLDVLATPEGDLLEDLIPDNYSPTPPEKAEQTLLGNYIDAALQNLSPRERSVIRLRFGLDGIGRECTLAEVAERLGLSRERIRQIERDALRKLQSPMVRKVLRDYIE